MNGKIFGKPAYQNITFLVFGKGINIDSWDGRLHE
jgi:hypothetical protein